ncbi:MAG: HEAT repeat domain-containing protein [Myxococcales bacterium]|nr:HEAT repeat domain-containing protein [Myxococcales bacterium]MDD9965067.1 HEAT repeat domain-containing protein [Myxococcales bacterium]
MPDSLPPSSAQRLRKLLSHGQDADDYGDPRTALGLPSTAEDRTVARNLVREIARDGIGRLRLASWKAVEVERPRESSRVFENRASYLMRLTTGTDERGMDLGRLDDLRTLLAVLRAGTLRQQRAAALRLGELLHDPKGVPGDQVRLAVDTVVHLRRFDIAYELSSACAQLPGAEGRRARASRKGWDKLVEDVTGQVLSFWDGQLIAEPILALHGDQRAQLLARARDLPALLIMHVCAVIEGSGGVDNIADRRAMLAALQNAGDPRLVPTLRSVLLDGPDSELVRPATRALGRIDDPRVHPILKRAYERAVRAEHRLAIAASLGMVGDARGLPYAREVLEGGDTLMLPRALAALDHIGTYDDVQAVTQLLAHEDPSVVMAAVRTLGRIGDSRALMPLSRLSAATDRSALRAEIEESQAAVHARMELLGEEPPPAETASETFDTTKLAAIVKKRDPTMVRIRAGWALLTGYAWLAIGMRHKAAGRFEAAAALRPEWATPVLSVAMMYARGNNHAQALATFRRALEVDRAQVEQHPLAVRYLAQAFLRRAEAVEQDGREDVAFGLLEEALALDLRKAPSGLRFALSERHEALKARAS